LYRVKAILVSQLLIVRGWGWVAVQGTQRVLIYISDIYVSDISIIYIFAITINRFLFTILVDSLISTHESYFPTGKGEGTSE